MSTEDPAPLWAQMEILYVMYDLRGGSGGEKKNTVCFVALVVLLPADGCSGEPGQRQAGGSYQPAGIVLSCAV